MDFDTKIELSIIAPMYNEEENVIITFEKITTELDKIGKLYEIIFVNDGSTDNTYEVCKRLQQEKLEVLKVVSYFPNCGRGKALQEGFKLAKGKYVFTVDFDLSYDASHITQMYECLIRNSQIDIVLTSAYMKGGKTIGVPKNRLLISKLGNRVLSYVFPVKIATSTCVVRGYKNHVIKSLSLDSVDKEIHLEILSKAFALGYQIKEIPGVLERRKAGKSSFKFSATSQSHIIFLLTEKPAFYFRMMGMIFFILSILTGGGVLFNRIYKFSANSEFWDFISPSLVLFLLIISVLFFVVSILALLFSELRREIIKMQAMLRSKE